MYRRDKYCKAGDLNGLFDAVCMVHGIKIKKSVFSRHLENILVSKDETSSGMTHFG